MQAILTRTPPADAVAAPTIASVIMQPTACSLGDRHSDATVGAAADSAAAASSGGSEGTDLTAFLRLDTPPRAGGWMHVRFYGESGWTRVAINTDELC